MDAADPELTIAVSALGSRLAGLHLPDPHPAVDYLILVQAPELIPHQLLRADVQIERLDTLGLSLSRNAALALAKGQFLLLSDDDISLDLAAVLALRDVLVARPELTVAAGWRRERLPQGGRRGRAHRLTRWNSGRICAPEFLLRMADVRRVNGQFDAAFGVGAPYPLAEDYIFLTDLFKAGLHGAAVPISVGSHRAPSSGESWSDPKIRAARGAMLQRVFGRAAPLVRIAYALRHRQKLGPAFLRFAFGMLPGPSWAKDTGARGRK